MGDYPDPDEEFELMHSDDFDLLREMEDDSGSKDVIKKVMPAKRSLDFSSPIQKQPVLNADQNNKNDLGLSQLSQPSEDNLTTAAFKRTAEDLFGDINDIDFDNVGMPSKRQKTEEDNDLELINKIIEGRKMKQLLAEPCRLIDDKPKYNANQNISLKIPKWDFMSITNFDGKRFYVRLESDENWQKSLDIQPDQLSLKSLFAPVWEEARKIFRGSSLGPLRRILHVMSPSQTHDTIENESKFSLKLFEKYHLYANTYTNYIVELTVPWETNIPKDHTFKLEAKEKQVEAELVQETNSTPKPDLSDLWVEKYKPKSYIDLLSEEPVNRCLLHWLHLWDKIVFNKEIKTAEPQQRSSFSKRTGQFQMSSKWRGKKEEPEMDDDGRPHHRVALLCGPPGAGKTTLAHMLARLAGYRPVELNASDERSTEQFQTALQNATLMRSVLDAEKRPNCLILDEIDGAPIQTVELLVRWCTASNKEEGKKKSKIRALKRPVIAICNDLYATSLRPLRPVSLIVSVGAVSASRLSARLSAVARRERLSLAARALAALAARAGGDVRAALHALGFLTAGGGRRITVEDVENVAIGTKDCSQSVMQALQAIFTLNDKDHNAVLKTIQAAGEYERLADGIFENYLSARADGRLAVSCATSASLAEFDCLQAWLQRTAVYSLYGALPARLAHCRRLLATRQPQRLRFPLVAQEMYRKKVELDSILWSIWRGSTVYNAKKALNLDIIPLLPYVLSPVLRSANIQLCSESERQSVSVCARAQCDYGLRYEQRRGEGGYTHALEPDLYRLAYYGSEERVAPPPAVRQAIAREQQLEIIRRNEEMMNRMSGRTEEKQEIKPRETKERPVEVVKERLPNHLQRLQPKAVERAPQVQKDFFGRMVPIVQVQNQAGVSATTSSSSVFYQYREGYNNAVRRNVRMRDLL